VNSIARMSAGIAGVLLLVSQMDAPALAQGIHTYVASYGSGTSCSRSTPCADLQNAYNGTMAGGEITCLDSGEFYGGLTITKAITIDCGGNVASVYYALRVNARGAVVRLRGITAIANGVEPYGFSISDGIVHIENCRFLNYAASTGFAGIAGINFAPATSGSQLVVTDSFVSGNGNGVSGGGIVIQPGAGVAATVTIDRTRVQNNGIGIYANAGSGSIHGVVRDSIVVGNSTWGIGAVGAKTTLLIENVTISGNTRGLVATNNGSILVSRSSIVLNRTGLAPSAGGTLVSYKNNNLSHNTNDGAFSSTLLQK
jgi:hypothetical protein